MNYDEKVTLYELNSYMHMWIYVGTKWMRNAAALL